jgi:hypothetical protein
MTPGGPGPGVGIEAAPMPSLQPVAPRAELNPQGVSNAVREQQTGFDILMGRVKESTVEAQKQQEAIDKKRESAAVAEVATQLTQDVQAREPRRGINWFSRYKQQDSQTGSETDVRQNHTPLDRFKLQPRDPDKFDLVDSKTGKVIPKQSRNTNNQQGQTENRPKVSTLPEQVIPKTEWDTMDPKEAAYLKRRLIEQDSLDPEPPKDTVQHKDWETRTKKAVSHFKTQALTHSIQQQFDEQTPHPGKKASNESLKKWNEDRIKWVNTKRDALITERNKKLMEQKKQSDDEPEAIIANNTPAAPVQNDPQVAPPAPVSTTDSEAVEPVIENPVPVASTLTEVPSTNPATETTDRTQAKKQETEFSKTESDPDTTLSEDPRFNEIKQKLRNEWLTKNKATDFLDEKGQDFIFGKPDNPAHPSLNALTEMKFRSAYPDSAQTYDSKVYTDPSKDPAMKTMQTEINALIAKAATEKNGRAPGVIRDTEYKSFAYLYPEKAQAYAAQGNPDMMQALGIKSSKATAESKPANAAPATKEQPAESTSTISESERTQKRAARIEEYRNESLAKLKLPDRPNRADYKDKSPGEFLKAQNAWVEQRLNAFKTIDTESKLLVDMEEWEDTNPKPDDKANAAQFQQWAQNYTDFVNAQQEKYMVEDASQKIKMNPKAQQN